jgi:riboflavin kinase/FMN adenylyltransferase
MKVLYGLKQAKKYKKPVVAIGVFDGVHRGHRIILTQAVRTAKEVGGRSMVLTFWPHPQGQSSLYSLKHRLKIFAALGIDVCVVLRFTKGLFRLSGEDFVRRVLSRKLNACYIYVGNNFRFGRNAAGNTGLLKRLARIYGYKLKVFKVVRLKDQAISSSNIRRLISNGDLCRAQRLLGNRVSILGEVVKGSSLGRKLGFPTANIRPQHEVIPPNGIYAVEIISGNKKFKGVCYIGTRPTFSKDYDRSNDGKSHIEVHILGFKRSIYGRELEIRFLQKIRQERKFSSREELTKNIKKDIRSAKSAFSRH